MNKEIEGNMDMIVKEEVQAYLQSSISSQLQQELRERKKELDEVHRDLHNSYADHFWLNLGEDLLTLCFRVAKARD